MVHRMTVNKTVHLLLSFALLGMVALAVFVPSKCYAQRANRLLDSEESTETFDGVILPFDRNLSRGMHLARQRIAAGEYTQAIRFLDEILSQEQDSFIKISESGEHAGLKELARRLLRDLPAEGKQTYETTFSPTARRELQNAIANGDFNQIRQIVGRFFYTPAGYEATFLLAQYESDHGQHLAASLLYKQLLDTPEAASRLEPQLSIFAAVSFLAADDQLQAESILEGLKNKPYQSAQIAGTLQSLKNIDQDALRWITNIIGEPDQTGSSNQQQWLTSRGNAARNGQVSGGLPHLHLQWKSRLLANAKLEGVYDELTTGRLQSAVALPVATTPLAVGDYIITRSPHSLVAIDFRTGKLVWKAEPQRFPEIDHIIDVAGPDTFDGKANSSQAFSQRLWEDSLYGSMSSDGQRVYVLRDLSHSNLGKQDPALMRFMNGRRQLRPRPYTNRLCAFELATQGKLVWEIDGASSSGPFQDVFFLGAPLAVGQSLYCLAETKDGEVFLAVLERKTGRLQWRQQLAELESEALTGNLRKLQASSPSYDEGMLVCPTGAGAVIGIDLAQNTLAWAYRYQTNLNPIRAFQRREVSHGAPEGKWIDGAAIIANGKVILTPQESDFLHCIDLKTGKLLWKKRRENKLFVAGVYQDRVVVVENDGISALQLETGNWAWQSAKTPFPHASIPSGRGFISHGKYFLPLSTAKVVAVDLEIGAIVDEVSARDGQILGNLVCYQGAVISQDGQQLIRFDQIDVLRKDSESRLKQSPNDPEALRSLGEITYNEGSLDKAVDLLVRAYHASPDDLRTREVLGEALVVALDEDFATFQGQLPLLEDLQDSIEGGQLTLLRLQARGLFEINDPLGAFQVCLQLYDAIDRFGDAQVLQIGRHHEIQVPRWIRAQVADIWENSNDEQRESLTEAVKEIIDSLKLSDGNNRLRLFCDCFGSLRIAEPMILQLANEYSQSGQILKSQQLYLHLASSQSSENIAGEALAKCSQGLHETQFSQLASLWHERLRTEFADVVCSEGLTGADLYDKYLAEGWIDSLTWPYGKVEVSTAAPNNTSALRHRNFSHSNVRLERSDDLLRFCDVFLSSRTNELEVRDSLGRKIFSTSLESKYIQKIHDPSHVYAVARGNLLVVSFGEQIIAFDTLQTSNSGAAEPLWSRNVATSFAGSQYSMARQVSVPSGRPGSRRIVRAQRNGKWTGIVGPLNHDSCVFQEQTRLVCVNAITGNQLWSRSDVPLGCDLYGDENFVIAVPPGSKRALLYSAFDGRELGESVAPKWNEHLATMGRNVVRWRRLANSRMELSSYDVVAGESNWKHEFNRGSKVSISRGQFVAVVDADGHCAIVDASTGEAIVEQNLAPLEKMQDVYLLAGNESFILAVKQKSKTNVHHINALNRNDSVVLGAGKIYHFDRKTGKQLWSSASTLDRQALMLAQPADLPVIVFVANVTRRDARGGRPGIKMLVLEKASGRQLIHNNELPGSNGNHCLIKLSDSKKNTVEIEMSRQTVAMNFTDLPRPPEPPRMSEGDYNTPKSNKGLLGIGKKILGGN